MTWPLDHDIGISTAYLSGWTEPWSMSTQEALSRHVSRLKILSSKGTNMNSDYTYCTLSA